MLSYNHFTLDERKYLQELLSQSYSMRKIAGFLGRSPSSVSREIQRNRTRRHPKNKPDNRYWYHHWRAQILYTVRKKTVRQVQKNAAAWHFCVLVCCRRIETFLEPGADRPSPSNRPSWTLRQYINDLSAFESR